MKETTIKLRYTQLSVILDALAGCPINLNGR